MFGFADVQIIYAIRTSYRGVSLYYRCAVQFQLLHVSILLLMQALFDNYMCQGVSFHNTNRITFKKLRDYGRFLP